VVEETQHVGQQARPRQKRERHVEREVANVFVAAVGRRERNAGDADHDRSHREVLDATSSLAEQALPHEHEHQQAGGERRLHDDQRREDQRDHLQRPAEHREPRAEQPAPASDQPRGKRQPQMVVQRRLLGVHRLIGDPYAVEARGGDRREQTEDELFHARR
jgi:hypothetical protein